MTKITHDLLVLHRKRATGELVVRYSKDNPAQWQLYFYLGRLVYATGGLHPARRWYRALKYQCPEVFASGWFQQAEPQDPFWEIDLLNQALNQGQISTIQVKAIVQNIAEEVMFALLGQRVLISEWQPGRQIAQRTAFLSVEPLIQKAQQLRRDWQNFGLGTLQDLVPQFSPDLAPVLRNRPKLESQTSNETYKSLMRLMKGQMTLWDIALEMQRPLPLVIRALLPLIRRGVVELRPIADVAIPGSKFLSTSAPPVTPPKAKTLIACIDDSPTVSQAMAKILEPAGYEVMAIDNPLQDFSKLLERKPALIFLDLVMPNTNGYELCTFLRKTSAFQYIPIVILTGHDGVIDRVRAKLAGSSDFLAKPPEAAKVLQVVQKYLIHSAGEVSDSQSNWATV